MGGRISYYVEIDRVKV